MTSSADADSATSGLTLDTASTLLDLLRMRSQNPGKVSSIYKEKGEWKSIRWQEELQRIGHLAAGFQHLGLRCGDRVAIFADTRFEWTLSALALFANGVTIVPIYGSDTPAEIAYILQNSGAVGILIDHDAPDARHKMPGRLARLREVQASIPCLKHVVLFDLPAPQEGVLSLAEIEADGAKWAAEGHSWDSLVEATSRALKPDDTAFLLYTSGTTGVPKGVMLTHANWTSQAKSVATNGIVKDDEIILLFLPLAHAFALIAFAAHLGNGLTIAYAESIDKAIANAAETRANLMICVPRVLEKAYNKIVSEGSSKSGVNGQIFRWGMALFDEYAEATIAGRELSSIQWTLAEKLVFRSVRTKLQARFGALTKFISGGAPLSKKIGIFLNLCGFTVCEGYGLTETCAPTHSNLPLPGKLKMGTVGRAWDGVQVRVAEDGEILMKGPQIMKGYFNMPEATAAAIDEDGWFHTGDIGVVDVEGFLTITDRKKDLLKTSGGKYIAPQELENGLKTEPLIGSVLIIGDRRKFVSALVTLDPASLTEFAAKTSLPQGTFAELSQRPEVKKKIEAAVKALNAKLPSYATIKKFAVLDHQWTQADGMITPTLKVKRKEVLKRYADIIDGFYDGEHFE